MGRFFTELALSQGEGFRIPKKSDSKRECGDTSLPGDWGCPPEFFFPLSASERGTQGERSKHTPLVPSQEGKQKSAVADDRRISLLTKRFFTSFRMTVCRCFA